jgi:microcystin-dependent protein
VASNVDKYLDTGEHAAIDHTGIPGVGSGGGGITGEVVPAGVIIPFGGPISSVPSGYLPCDGTVVAQASYPALFTAIGTTWDIGGEGVGNFRLPDFRGKAPLGLNDGTLPAGVDGGFTTRVLASLGGLETQPAHGHATAVHSHSNSLTGGGESPGTAFNGTGTVVQSGTGVTVAALAHQHNTFNHSHNDSTGSGGSAVGGSSGGSTMSPFAVCPYIIKAEEAAPTVSGIGSDTLPTGTITPYAGTVVSIPVGFLPCDGSLADQVVEADLFAVIGTNWNTGGEPGGFFRLPDFRGKSVVGLNDVTLPNGVDGGFTTRTLAATGGAEADTAPLPVHNHNIPGNMSNGSGTDLTRWAAGTTPDLSSQSSNDTDNAGSGGVHNTMHPFAVCPYIIKSRQVGGGIGTSGQDNGGALQGPQPTLNFIPSGGAGVSVVENVGQNRLDITISAPSGGVTSVTPFADDTGFSSTGGGSMSLSVPATLTWGVTLCAARNTTLANALGFGFTTYTGTGGGARHLSLPLDGSSMGSSSGDTLDIPGVQVNPTNFGPNPWNFNYSVSLGGNNAQCRLVGGGYRVT